MINQVNALPAITGLSVQAVIGDARLRRIMTVSMRENVRIAALNRVRFEKLQGLSHRGLRLFSRLPLWLGQLLPMMMSARVGSTPNPGSTLQSIRRGQPTEIDYLNGAVVTAAKAVGRDAPVNGALVAMVHEVEASGEFLSPAEVVERVRQLLLTHRSPQLTAVGKDPSGHSGIRVVDDRRRPCPGAALGGVQGVRASDPLVGDDIVPPIRARLSSATGPAARRDSGRLRRR